MLPHAPILRSMKPHFRSLPLLALKSFACLIATGPLLASSALAGEVSLGDIISINDMAILEGNSGTTTLNFTVTRERCPVKGHSVA